MAKKAVVRKTRRMMDDPTKAFMKASQPPKFIPTNSAMSLCGQAEDAISILEARLSKIILQIRRINDLN